ncbi:MAG: hypothetical protein AB1498_06715 [bacterium]
MRGIQTAELGTLNGDVERPGDPFSIHFRVIDLKEVEEDMCYVVEMTEEGMENEEALQLYVRKDDFTLKKVREITKDRMGEIHKTDKYNESGHDFIMFTMFSMPFFINIPCDFPNFPATNDSEKRTIQLPDSARFITQKVTFADANTVEIELSTENNGGLLKTIQIWERGKPWWSSIKRTFTYKDTTKPGQPEVTKIENDNILAGTDLIPPVLNLTVTPTVLWPPNHEMVEITPEITVSDNYDRFPEIKILSVESNEPDDAFGEGDGHTTQDIQITKVWDNVKRKEIEKIFLRAEREGKGNGRIYTITYVATDFSGNSSTVSVRVTVAHDIGEEDSK